MNLSYQQKNRTSLARLQEHAGFLLFRLVSDLYVKDWLD
jgi:hypothetical protein